MMGLGLYYIISLKKKKTEIFKNKSINGRD
jgi:hypothetical protein